MWLFSAGITPRIQEYNTLRFLELTAARAAQPPVLPRVTLTFRYPAQGGKYRIPTRIKPLGTTSSFCPGALQKLLLDSSRAVEVTAQPQLSLILVYEADSDFELIVPSSCYSLSGSEPDGSYSTKTPEPQRWPGQGGVKSWGRDRAPRLHFPPLARKLFFHSTEGETGKSTVQTSIGLEERNKKSLFALDWNAPGTFHLI